jgi:hypothetical protein
MFRKAYWKAASTGNVVSLFTASYFQPFSPQAFPGEDIMTAVTSD